MGSRAAEPINETNYARIDSRHLGNIDAFFCRTAFLAPQGRAATAQGKDCQAQRLGP